MTFCSSPDSKTAEVCNTGCPPAGLQFLEFPMVVSYATCSNVQVYGILPGDDFLFTTCVPPGVPRGTGDPSFTAVTDNVGNTYAATNDDCTASNQLPQLVGWD